MVAVAADVGVSHNEGSCDVAGVEAVQGGVEEVASFAQGPDLVVEEDR